MRPVRGNGRGALALRALAWSGGIVLLSRVPAAVQLLPVLGLLRGPMGALLLFAGVGVALAPFLEGGLRRREAPRPAALFALSAAGFLALGLHYAARLQVSGDEPHYLLIAQSLWREGDLDLRDNLAREDFREYTPGPLAPHWGAPRPDGRPFPAHSPGLPLLLAPLYAFGGRRACIVAMALAAAALTLEVLALAERATGDRRAALFAWAVAAGPPLTFYAFQIYTEVPSALAAAVCLRILLGAPGAWEAAAAALAASALPWLHLKMIPAAAALGLLALHRLRGRRLVAFLAVAGAMAAGFLLYYYEIYGRATPLAVYGGFPPGEAGSPLQAALGFLFDRSFGLVPHAPVWVLALAGLVPLGRRDTREVLPHALLSAAILAPVLMWRMWWGGQCAPGRFLVPLLPFLGVAVAASVAGPPRGLARWRLALLALGAALALFMVARPASLMLLNRGDRPTRVWAALSGEAPVARYLPSLVSGDAAEWRVAVVWALALGLLLVLDRAARHREAADRLFGGLGLPVLLLLLVGVIVDGWARLPPPSS